MPYETKISNHQIVQQLFGRSAQSLTPQGQPSSQHVHDKSSLQTEISHTRDPSRNLSRNDFASVLAMQNHPATQILQLTEMLSDMQTRHSVCTPAADCWKGSTPHSAIVHRAVASGSSDSPVADMFASGSSDWSCCARYNSIPDSKLSDFASR